ncbi:hypothetical protein AQI88_09605 [Streptomyces cellostaticus]|uniref:DUF4253 domain-containing protein n=1 Tax=Streptomyces cellostaticus TaxID=67285 RepID=A0A101NPJ5_9ACTN|nr:DUF4253 domain-containing protein [Streptomyces cellostaticus]KUM96751.1 hypothetical protein AQI88_09605 [Streptomyces cellostaticus]GHI05845.1 hypothetical protein Scel_41660 [Streptomyces cellostaticus]
MATLPNPLPKLATDPSGRTLGLQLPPGRLIDVTDDGPWHEPLLWHADKAAAGGTWKALGTPAARAGLLPVLVDVGGAQGGPVDWRLMPELMSYPGDHDVEELLAEYWEDSAEEELAEEIEPFGFEWPGLAPAGSATADPDTRAAQVADSLAEGTESWFKEPRLALVPARRSADIPAAIGWTGPLNYDNDVARLCTILRSWEDRFGIRVVGLGFDTLVVSVAAPPTTLTDAEALAAEHFAFCPDNITQGSGGLQAYAKDLVGDHTWYFWWD